MKKTLVVSVVVVIAVVVAVAVVIVIVVVVVIAVVVAVAAVVVAREETNHFGVTGSDSRRRNFDADCVQYS